VKYSWNLEKLVEQLKENKVKILVGFRIFSDTEIRKLNQANIKYIYIKWLEVPNEFYNALYKKEITQSQYEAKYKKHLQTLKLRLEIDKTDSVALLIDDLLEYQENRKKCYNVILPEFMKGVVGLKEIKMLYRSNFFIFRRLFT
jgi:ribonuclease HIII